MPKHRDPLPDDLKELISHCRAGKLFAVQAWIKEGKRYLAPEGNFANWPFRAAFNMGFHSLIEVFLKAGIPQHECDRGLRWAVASRRLDLVELLAAYGADWKSITVAMLISAREPSILRWFLKRGIDLETGYPIAKALAERHRDFLGVYMDVRDTVPSARTQAAMALRVHAKEGNLKWVSLLLWAGADPRANVPDFAYPNDKDFEGSALESAVMCCKTDVVRKFDVIPGVDDPSYLLGRCWMCDDPKLVQFLLDVGADPNAGSGETNPMCALMSNLRRTLNPAWPYRRTPDTALRCLELAAKHGGRWRPSSLYEIRDLRMMLARAGSYAAVEALRRLVAANVFAERAFQELMKTPRMKDLLDSGMSGTVALKKAAGHERPLRRNSPRRPFTVGRNLQVAKADFEDRSDGAELTRVGRNSA